MSDWKRAGTVQFGVNVRCREVVLNGVKCTVYADVADVDAVDLALYPKSIDVHALGDEMPTYIAVNPNPYQTPPTKTYPPSTLESMVEEFNSEASLNLKKSK